MKKRFPALSALTKVTLAIALACGLGHVAKAQQQPQLSQYTANMLLFNPAVAGMEDFIAARAGYRQQFVGVPDGPQTVYVNVHGALNQRDLNKEDLGALPMRGASTIRFKTETIRKIRHGVGGTFVSDRAGQFTRNSASGGYAIHLPFARSWYFSGGAQLGVSFLQLGTNWNREGFITNPNADPALAGRTLGLPEASIGGMVYNDKLYVGLSANQLLQNRLRFGETNISVDQKKLNVHYYLTAGYRLPLTDELDFAPTTLVKFSRYTYAADLQARVRFRQAFYAGIGYRLANTTTEVTGDGVTGLVGLSFNKLVDVAYSFDFTTSGLNVGSNGSHEIVVGVRLYNAKKANPRIW